MKHYYVTFALNIYADSPEDAAMEAMAIHEKNDSTQMEVCVIAIASTSVIAEDRHIAH